jgi:PAS domain S-box-containing protein
MTWTTFSSAELLIENRDLRARLQEAHETLVAIRSGEVDALVVAGPRGDQVFTLHAADRAFRVLVEKMSEGALTIAANGTILYSNPRFGQMIGQALDKVEGSGLAEYVVEADGFLLDGLIREGLTGTSHGALHLLTTTGRTVPVHFASSQTGMDANDPVVLCIVITDLTQQQELLDHERTARAEAEVAVRMRDEFMAIASHELRTPVTVIKSTAQVLLRLFNTGNVKSTQAIERLQTVNEMSDRLKLLIADLLDVTRLRTGRLQLQPEHLDLADLAQEVVKEQRLQPGSERPLKLSVIGVLPPLSADPNRMQQVLSNLVENAIKYSPAGGEVEISLREHDLGVSVMVSDHGIGLPPGAAESIFEPFGRASNAQRQQLPGMGLGLYIARQIVEQHGGRIWAKSDGEGLGTQLHVWLPGVQLQATLQRPSRVLVVDDEAAIRSALGDVFEVEGYDCRLAANGREALSILSSWDADLIVLDLTMPVMDGWAFRREQHAAPTVRDIPVVVISARQSHDTRDAELVPAAVIAKPFDLDELVETVHQILSVSSR